MISNNYLFILAGAAAALLILLLVAIVLRTKKTKQHSAEIDTTLVRQAAKKTSKSLSKATAPNQPAEVSTLIAQVDVLLGNNDYARAESTLNMALKRNHQQPELWSKLLQVYQIQDDRFAIKHLLNTVKTMQDDSLYQQLSEQLLDRPESNLSVAQHLGAAVEADYTHPATRTEDLQFASLLNTLAGNQNPATMADRDASASQPYPTTVQPANLSATDSLITPTPAPPQAAKAKFSDNDLQQNKANEIEELYSVEFLPNIFSSRPTDNSDPAQKIQALIDDQNATVMPAQDNPAASPEPETTIASDLNLEESLASAAQTSTEAQTTAAQTLAQSPIGSEETATPQTPFNLLADSAVTATLSADQDFELEGAATPLTTTEPEAAWQSLTLEDRPLATQNLSNEQRVSDASVEANISIEADVSAEADLPLQTDALAESEILPNANQDALPTVAFLSDLRIPDQPAQHSTDPVAHSLDFEAQATQVSDNLQVASTAEYAASEQELEQDPSFVAATTAIDTPNEPALAVFDPDSDDLLQRFPALRHIDPISLDLQLVEQYLRLGKNSDAHRLIQAFAPQLDDAQQQKVQHLLAQNPHYVQSVHPLA